MSVIISVLNRWSSVIAFIALVVSIWSLIRTYRLNVYSIDVFNGSYDQENPNPFMLRFQLINNSHKAIKIKKVRIETLSGIEIQPLKHQPRHEPLKESSSMFDLPSIDLRTFSEYDYENDPTMEIIAPFKTFYVRYYVAQVSSPLKITITTDKRINNFSRTKSFITDFVEFD